MQTHGRKRAVHVPVTHFDHGKSAGPIGHVGSPGAAAGAAGTAELGQSGGGETKGLWSLRALPKAWLKWKQGQSANYFGSMFPLDPFVPAVFEPQPYYLLPAIRFLGLLAVWVWWGFHLTHRDLSTEIHRSQPRGPSKSATKPGKVLKNEVI